MTRLGALCVLAVACARPQPARGPTAMSGTGGPADDSAARGASADAATPERETAPDPRTAASGCTTPQGRPVDPDREMDRRAIAECASWLYDRGDFDGARAVALYVVAGDPMHARMLRLLTGVACVKGEYDEARRFNDRLPAGDQGEMKAQCKRYGIDLP